MTLLSKNAELVGFRLALLAIVCWSSAFLVARFLLGGDARVDPVSLVFYRFLIGSAAILGYAAWRKESLRFRSLREFMQMLAVAFFMLFLMSLLFFIGQQTASAITAALFLESGPAIIAIVWKLIRRHPTERREILAVGCGLLGCMFVLNMISMRGFHYGFASWLGQLALIGSAVSWVIGSAIGRKLMAAPNRVVLMGYCELASAVMVIPFLLIFHSQLIIPAGWDAWGAIVLLGLVPTAAAFIAWSEAPGFFWGNTCRSITFSELFLCWPGCGWLPLQRGGGPPDGIPNKRSQKSHCKMQFLKSEYCILNYRIAKTLSALCFFRRFRYWHVFCSCCYEQFDMESVS